MVSGKEKYSQLNSNMYQPNQKNTTTSTNTTNTAITIDFANVCHQHTTSSSLSKTSSIKTSSSKPCISQPNPPQLTNGLGMFPPQPHTVGTSLNCKNELDCSIKEYTENYCRYFLDARRTKSYVVFRSNSEITTELKYYLTHHMYKKCGVMHVSGVQRWRLKAEKTTRWISKHSRQTASFNEPPLDERLVKRAVLAFQAFTECLRQWQDVRENLSENKLQVMFERTFYPELFAPIPEDQDKRRSFMKKYDSKRGAKMSPGSLQNCFHYMLNFMMTEKKKSNKRKRN